MTSPQMIPLRSQAEFENLLRPRRATEDDIQKAYAPYMVLSFSATWCGPCKRLDKMSAVRQSPKVVWVAIDVDEVPEALAYCGLQSIPSFVLLKDGTFVDRIAGVRGPEDILAWLEKNMVPVNRG